MSLFQENINPRYAFHIPLIRPAKDDIDFYRHARFWAKLFLLNFSVGVISGIPLEFEFGTNWSLFSRVTGEFFGNILGYEGAMAFMLEAGFLGIMLFGWKRVPRGIHLFSSDGHAVGLI